MTSSRFVPLLFVLAAVGCAAISGASQRSSADGNTANPQSSPARPQADLDGQKIFDQNCSRCHNAPEGFSTRISGTVIRHMRVRANLSRQQEEALLRFLNP